MLRMGLKSSSPLGSFSLCMHRTRGVGTRYVERAALNTSRRFHSHVEPSRSVFRVETPVNWSLSMNLSRVAFCSTYDHRHEFSPAYLYDVVQNHLRKLFFPLRKSCEIKRSKKEKENPAALKFAACSALELEQISVDSWTESLLRLARILLQIARFSVLFSPLVLTSPVMFLCYSRARRKRPTLERNISTCSTAAADGGNDLKEWFMNTWWTYALWSVEHTSPAVIKFLQWASTRRDLFASDFCDHFHRLHLHAPEHSWDQTVQTLDNEFHPQWRELFLVDPVPIGSGCIAQVYSAIKLDTNERVALKVVHPHVKRKVYDDLAILRCVTRAVEYCFPTLTSLSMCESVDEFAKIMIQQLNMKKEAENLDRFNGNFQSYAGVSFPTPYHDFTTNHVLVERFMDGKSVSEVQDVETSRLVARRAFQAFLKMVFVDNFVHGDLHPGNFLISTAPQKNRSQSPNILLIDAGIVTELSKKDRDNLIELFFAVVRGEGYKAGQLLIERSPGSRRVVDVDQDHVFCTEIERIVAEARKHDLKLSHVKVASLLRDVMSLCCTHHVKLQPKYAALVISIGVLEGVGRGLDAELDLLAMAVPVLKDSVASIRRDKL